MKMSLGVRNARGVAANFYAADVRAQRGVRRAVKASGIRQHEDTRSRTPVRRGFLRSQLRLQFSEGGLAHSIGWYEADFTAAGEPPYFYYVVLGTRKQAANDPLTPAFDAEKPRFDADLRKELSAAYRRRR